MYVFIEPFIDFNAAKLIKWTFSKQRNLKLLSKIMNTIENYGKKKDVFAKAVASLVLKVYRWIK